MKKLQSLIQAIVLVISGLLSVVIAIFISCFPANLTQTIMAPMSCQVARKNLDGSPGKMKRFLYPFHAVGWYWQQNMNFCCYCIEFFFPVPLTLIDLSSKN